MKFLALVGLATAIQLNGDNGIIDLTKTDPADCDKRLWISDDELRW